MLIKLACFGGSLSGQRFEFKPQEINIGRAGNNQIAFDAHVDTNVSGTHCQIYHVDNMWCVRDMGSKHGTYLDGNRLDAPALLTHGAVVQLGRKGPQLSVELPMLESSAEPDKKKCVRITGVSGSLKGKYFEFGEERITFGRAADNTIQLDSQREGMVSGHHCELFYERSRFYARDLGSRHGTLLNGKPVTAEPVQVSENSVLRLGRKGPEFIIGRPGAEGLLRTMESSGDAASMVPGHVPTAMLDRIANRIHAQQPQSRRKRVIVAVAVVSIIAILLVAGALTFHLYINSLFAEPAVNSALVKMFGSGSGVKSVKIHWPTEVEIISLKVPDAERAGENAIAAGEVHVMWEPWELWKNKRINRISVQQPVVNLRRALDGKWNINVAPKKDSGTSVNYDRASIYLQHGEAQIDLGHGAYSSKQINAIVRLPDSQPPSPLRVESFSATLDTQTSRLKGVLSSDNMSFGPADEKSGRLPFSGLMRFQDLQWDSGRGWSVKLPRNELRFEGAATISKDVSLLDLQNLELVDVCSIRQAGAEWQSDKSVLKIGTALFKLDINALRALAPELPVLKMIDGTPEVQLKNVEFGLPAGERTAFVLKADVDTAGTQKTGVRLAPDGKHLADISELHAKIDLSQQAVTLPHVALKLNAGSSASGTAAFTSHADLANKSLPVWLQLFGNMKKLKIDFPLSGISRAEYVRALLGSDLLLEGTLRAENVDVQQSTVDDKKTLVELNGLSIHDLEILKWPVDSLLIDRPEGKLTQSLNVKTVWVPAPESARLAEAAVSTSVTGSGMELSADARVDFLNDIVRVSKAALTLPVERLARMSPLLKMAGFGGSGVVSLSDVNFELAGSRITACSANVDLKNVEALFSLGEKANFAGGIAGLRGLNGRTTLKLDVSDPERPRVRVEGKLAPSDAKMPMGFFSPSLGFEKENVEQLNLTLVLDLLPRNGRRDVDLKLTWARQQAEGFFNLNGNYRQSTENKAFYDLDFELKTSLLGNFAARYRGVYNSEKKNFLPTALKINETRLREVCEALSRIPALARVLPAPGFRDITIEKFQLQLDGDTSIDQIAAGKDDLRWTLDAAVSLCPQQSTPSAPRTVVKVFGSVRQERAPPAWLIEDFTCTLQGGTALDALGWQARLARDFAQDIKLQGRVRILEKPLLEIQIPAPLVLQVPELIVRSSSSTESCTVPSSVFRLSAARLQELEQGGVRLQIAAPDLLIGDWLRLSGKNLIFDPSAPAGGEKIQCALDTLSISDLKRARDFLSSATAQVPALRAMRQWLQNIIVSGSFNLTPLPEMELLSFKNDALRLNGRAVVSSLSLRQDDIEIATAPEIRADVALTMSGNDGLSGKLASTIAFSSGANFLSRIELPKTQASPAIEVSGGLIMRGGALSIDEASPLALQLPKLNVRSTGEAAAFALPLLHLVAPRGRFELIANGGRRTLRATGGSFTLVGDDLKKSQFVEASAAELSITADGAALDAVEASGVSLAVPDLAALYQSFVIPLMHLPAAQQPSISGRLALNEADITYQAKTGAWAFKTLVQPLGVGAAVSGNMSATVRGIGGTIPLALYKGQWPEKWDWNRGGELKIGSAQLEYKRSNAEPLKASVSESALKMNFKPNQFSLQSALAVNIPGGQLRLNSFEMGNPLAPLSDIRFGVNLNLGLDEFRRELGIDLKNTWLDFSRDKPVLELDLARCRLSRTDSCWRIDIGDAEPQGAQRLNFSIAPSASRDTPAFSIRSIVLKNVQAPHALAPDSVWSAERLELGAINFGNFGVLVDKLGEIDLQLGFLLENVKTRGGTLPEIFHQFESFRMELKTPAARNAKPFYNVKLTDALKQHMIKTLELSGIAAMVINSQKAYEFHQIGAVVKLKNNVLVGLKTAYDEKNSKYVVLQGIGKLDPSDPWGSEDMICYWPEFVNKIETRAVDIFRFSELISKKLAKESEEQKKLGVLGETLDGRLDVVDPSAAQNEALSTLIKKTNAVREGAYRVALDDYYKVPDGTADAEAFRNSRLALIREKAGRLSRNEVLQQSAMSGCWVQHPLTKKWIKAGELKNEYSELYKNELKAEIRAGRVPGNAQ
ncbi:MAG TPA: FHA domain-containing protein [Planctomycetota bacterium]|nr:FHA domain-containing protein [Planctomycetota bacterium]